LRSTKSTKPLQDSLKSCIDISVAKQLSDDDSIPTRSSLLARIKNHGDGASWHEFHDTYEKLIFGVACKAGLREAEAQDATQDTLVAVANNIGEFRYEPKRCAFKTWLLMITRQRIIWQIRKRQRSSGPLPQATRPVENSNVGWRPMLSNDDSSRTSTVDSLPDPASLNLDAVWEDEWRQSVLTLALQRVKAKVSERQFQIFELSAIQAWSVSEISQTLGISAARVYLARHRVAAVLKREVRQVGERL
jgi:RNA polymerase sigma-70 factor (ECF subfamily)